MPIGLQALEMEQALLQKKIRKIEAEQRKVNEAAKAIRQKELRARRELEALSTLIELARADDGDEPDEAFNST